MGFIVLFSSMTFWTTATYIDSEITPISINKKGKVLCKTRFTKNETGGCCGTKIEFGYCIVSEDTIVRFTAKVVDPDKLANYDIYSEQSTYWDAIFRAKTSQKQLKEIEEAVLKNKYCFSSCNADSFLIDKTFTISGFETNYKIPLNKYRQKALKGALSTQYYKNKKVHLLYDFGDLLIFKNYKRYNDKYEVIHMGADFNYYNPWTNDKGKKVNIGFELCEITGVLVVQ